MYFFYFKVRLYCLLVALKDIGPQKTDPVVRGKIPSPMYYQLHWGLTQCDLIGCGLMSFEIRDFHGGVGGVRLASGAVYTRRWMAEFWRNMLFHSFSPEDGYRTFI